MPSGDLATRNVTLTVPAMGKGKVTLSGQTSDWTIKGLSYDDIQSKSFEWSTENFWSETINNEVFFYAVFKAEFKDFKSTIAFKGTYIKAENKILYHGSMYKKNGHHDIDKDLSELNYIGGFNFSYDR